MQNQETQQLMVPHANQLYLIKCTKTPRIHSLLISHTLLEMFQPEKVSS